MLIVMRAIFPSVERVRRGSGGRGMVGMQGRGWDVALLMPWSL